MSREDILDMVRTGYNIRKGIIESGYTYEEIAEFLELSTPRVIYQWVKGKKLPSTLNLVKLSLIFDIKLEDILEIQDVF